MGARQATSVGQIVNIMSTDAQRMQELTTYLQMVWSAPLQISLSVFFLWKQVRAFCSCCASATTHTGDFACMCAPGRGCHSCWYPGDGAVHPSERHGRAIAQAHAISAHEAERQAGEHDQRGEGLCAATLACTLV